MSNSISLAICTFNRSGSLKLTLNSIAACASSFSPHDEVLIVDNNSSDKTSEVSGEFVVDMQKIGLRVRYIFESQQGLSAARNKAIDEFSGDYLFFIDDDVTILENTVNEYRAAIKRYPSCSIFGGRIEVDWGGKAPAWYRGDSLPLIDGLIGSYDLSGATRIYDHYMKLPYGANFGISAVVIRAVGKFDTSLGLKGNKIGRGEESDFIQRALDQGFKCLYVPDAVVQHRFQGERITIRYLYRYGIEKGKIVGEQNLNKPLIFIAQQLFKGVSQILKGRIDRFYQCVINIGIGRGVILSTSQKRR